MDKQSHRNTFAFAIFLVTLLSKPRAKAYGYSESSQHFISISDNQRRDGPNINYCTTVYNGIGVDKYTFSYEQEDYLMIAGRIVPDKGFKEAIQIAQETDHRLLIIGPVSDDNEEYFIQHNI